MCHILQHVLLDVFKVYAASRPHCLMSPNLQHVLLNVFKVYAASKPHCLIILCKMCPTAGPSRGHACIPLHAILLYTPSAFRTIRTLLIAPSAFLNVFRRPHCLNERLIVFCSVLLASFEGIPYLLLGLGDGQLHHWHLDAGTGDSLLCVHATFQANNVRRTLDYEFGDQLHQWHLDAATGDSLFCMHATFQAN